jgi:uncharacterized protein YdeI (YjbR/CyaY-like superfamily)
LGSIIEALCFGWIDSKINKRDKESHYQLFSVRNPKSNWSAVNKKKIEALLKAGRMQPAGLQAVAKAKANGTWDALNEIEQGILPYDLEMALKETTPAFDYFTAFPKSVKRGILEWILNAKTVETRSRRIHETVQLAAQNKRANQYNPK